MEPNNFESQIKEKLENNTIQPSSAAWDKLDVMLDAAQNTKKKKNFSWIYIAASIVGLLLIGTVFSYLTETKSTDLGNEVVIQYRKDRNSGIEEKVLEESVLTTTASSPDEKAIVVSEKQLSKTIEKEAVVNNINNKTERSIINQVNRPHWQNNQNKSVLIAEKSTPTMEEVVAQVVVSNDVVMKSSKVTVDASYLLSQVDTELELSFREKVISKVSKNYQTVKVAFANRNLE